VLQVQGLGGGFDRIEVREKEHEIVQHPVDDTPSIRSLLEGAGCQVPGAAFDSVEV
jgi:hypothetical protein